MKLRDFVETFANFLFGNRKSLLTLFALITVALGWSATQLRVDAGFEKMIPLQHPYMQTFLEYRKDFGGANRVVIALRAEEADDIYSPEFFKALKEVTDDVLIVLR